MNCKALSCDDGSTVPSTVIVLPAIILGFLMALQLGLVQYSRSIASSAAQDGAVVAAQNGSSVSEGVAATDALLNGYASGPLQTWSTTGTSTGDEVTITVTGSAFSVIPGRWSVTASRTLSVEEFRPQGITP